MAPEISDDLSGTGLSGRTLPVPPRPGRLIESASITRGLGIPDPIRITVHAKINGRPFRHLRATVVFVTRNDQRVVSDVTISAPSYDLLPPGGITFEALRSVQLHRIQTELTELLAGEIDAGYIPEPIVEGFRRVPRPGNQGRDKREYAAIAAMYIRHLESRTPLRDLVNELGPGYTDAGVRAMLNRARRHGLLTAAPTGQAGGALTPLAIQLLKPHADEQP